jgi:hypothetical protein
MTEIFPEPIRNLPEADIPLKGVVMAWVGRSAEPSKSRNAMVLGLTILNGLAVLASAWGALSGVYDQMAWGPVGAFALCTVGFLIVGKAGMSAGTTK